MDLKTTIVIVVLLLISTDLNAINLDDSVHAESDMKVCMNLYHQHHDYFNEAFSLQGLEIGIKTNQNLYLGLYGSCFVTYLRAEVNDKLQYVWIGQYGIHADYVCNTGTFIQPGIQLNAGTFAILTDEKSFELFQKNKAGYKLNGLLLSPQIFGQVDLSDWFCIRTGLSYNFYLFEKSPIIKKSDLNNVSFSFGLVYSLNI